MATCKNLSHIKRKMPSELYNKLLSCHWNKIVMLSFAVDSGFFEGVKRVLHVGEVKCRFFDSNIYHH